MVAETDAEKLKAMRGARQPSVTYRPPLDADESHLYSSQDALGPQSSVGSARNGTRGAELESSLTIGSRQQKALHGGAEGGAEFSMIPIDDRDSEEDGANDDDDDALRRTPSDAQEDQLSDETSPEQGAVLPSPSNAHEQQQHEHKHTEPAKNKSCHTFTRHHSLTMHNDDCECEEDSTLVTVHSTDQLPTIAPLNLNDPASFESDSPEISLHVHSSSHTHTVEDYTEPQIVSSSLDPAFVVATISPEYLSPDYWEDSAGPYPAGHHLVPRAPIITCTCAVPWRSMHHLWSSHVQPESHSRNIVFEGHKYPKWRGQFYPNGEPKSVLRGTMHEFGFLATLGFGAWVFSNCASGVSWVAAVIYIGTALFLYGTSSQFHRRIWSQVTYNRLKRQDHSAIFLLAAGSSTPSALLMIRDNWNQGAAVSVPGIILLVWAWSTALGGVFYSTRKELSGRVSLFGLVWMGVVGACMVPFVWPCYQVMLPFEFGAIIAAWLLYLVAILTYTHKWGNTYPSVWGYHEAFHALTIIGAVAAAVFNASICARIR